MQHIPARRYAHPAARNRIDRHGPGVTWIEPVAQPRGRRRARVPRHRNPTVIIRQIARAAGRWSAVQLTNDPMVHIKQRRTGRTRFRHAQAPRRMNVRAIAWHCRIVVRSRRRGNAVKRDAFLVGIRMMNARAAGRFSAAAAPTGKRYVPRRIRRFIKLHQREIRLRSRRPVERTRLKLIELPVTRPAARRTAHRSTRRVLKIPEHHQRRGITRINSAMCRGQEIRLQVLRCIVKHGPGAESTSTRGDNADGRNLVPPIVALRTNHVHVART